MTQSTVARSAPNLKFAHMGVAVRDMAVIERFYGDVLGFLVTDRGDFGEMEVVFMSRDPEDHHQLVFATGRPAQLPTNEFNPDFGPSIIQISFKMGSLEDLRDMKERLEASDASNITSASHGNAWSVYANDPEGNYIEFYVDTDWYSPQPFYETLDLDKSDQDIIAETRAMCMEKPGFKPQSEWQADISRKMPPPFRKKP